MTAHPPELADLDLFEVWSGAPELADRFDPFSFDHRMAAYRALLAATNRSRLFGPDNRQNLLWGLMFQHQWQFRTGRLGPTSRTTRRIDPDSPWGHGNYALCVVPWLGAVRAGVVPELPVAEPDGPTRFDHSPAGFAAGIADWQAYFDAVRRAAPEDLEHLRLALWKAHKSCLDVVAARLRGIDPEPYSQTELTFLQGWCRMVDYLWAAAWRTDFDFMVEHGSDVLPERLLDTEHLDDLPPKVRSNVENVLGLARTSDRRYALNLRLWSRIMRTRQARAEVLPLLDAVFNPSRENRAQRRKLLRYLLRP